MFDLLPTSVVNISVSNKGQPNTKNCEWTDEGYECYVHAVDLTTPQLVGVIAGIVLVLIGMLVFIYFCFIRRILRGRRVGSKREVVVISQPDLGRPNAGQMEQSIISMQPYYTTSPSQGGNEERSIHSIQAPYNMQPPQAHIPTTTYGWTFQSTVHGSQIPQNSTT